MWKLFGILEIRSSCMRPVDPERKLWFASDFPHLIKNFKSRIINSKILQVNISLIKIKKLTKILAFKNSKLFQVPKGQVDILHWKAVVKADSKLQIKVCSKLTQDHVQPRYFQTMNVRMVFQVLILR